MNQDKLMKTAKTLDFCVKIILIGNLIAIGLCLCGFLLVAIGNLTIPDRMIGPTYETIDAGLVTLRLAEEYVPDKQTSIRFMWMNGASILVGLVVIYFGCRYVRKILAQMILGNPFHRTVSDHLKKLSYVALMYGIIQNIITWVHTYSGFYHFGLESLAESEKIASVSANYELDTRFVLIFAVFLLTSYIFRYGSELQQLSDETL